MKRLLQLSFFTVAMLTGAAAFAQEQPRGMIDGSFDLKRAILSPAPIGPPSHFEPTAGAEKPAAEPAAVPKPEAAAAKPETRAAAAKPEAKPKAAASQARAQHKLATSKPRQKSAVAARKPRPNPLNAYAIDTRRQTWPCRGDGGICAWTQPR